MKKKLSTILADLLLFALLATKGMQTPAFSAPTDRPAVRGSLIAETATITNMAVKTNPPVAAPTNGIASSTNAPATLQNELLPAVEKDGDYIVAGFDKLASFMFVSSEKLHPTDPWEQIKKFIPASILALHGQKVVVKGFMLPTQVQDGVVQEFVLLRSQMTCCYGVMPSFNEWINVHAAAKNVSSVMDVPLTVYGTLHLKDFRVNGRLEGIYEMDCERVVVPKGEH